MVYDETIVALRDFLTQLAGANPDPATLAELGAVCRQWSARLAPFAVDEAQQIYARVIETPGRGQVTWPAVAYTTLDRDAVSGQVIFNRFFLGSGGAAHGGAIAFVFDEVAGRLAHMGHRRFARTAYLHVEYRSLTPIDVELTVDACFVGEERRKRLMHIELRDHDRLCAEADVLMVEIRPAPAG